MDLSERKIAVIGLGYVGLPLAVEFGKVRPVVGFDVRQSRIDELQSGKDSTREVEAEDLAAAKHLTYSASLDDLRDCGVFIVAVGVGDGDLPALHDAGADAVQGRQLSLG